MDRRQFLQAGGFVTLSVVNLGLFGCSSNDSSEDMPAQASGSGWQFPQSVASGDPRPDGVMLWTRALPASADPVGSSSAADFAIRLQVSSVDHSSALGSNAALSGSLLLDTTVPVRAAFDHTVRHKLTGLAPATTYYYQFSAGAVRSNIGRFKTAPALDAEVEELKFAFLSCQDWSINHWGAYAQIAAAEELDFIIHLGDYIYETVGESFQTGAVEARHTALSLPDGVYKSGSSGAKYASTLADYRYLYKQYRSDSRLQAVHERFAFVAIWDDHEFSDDCWNDANTYTNGSLDSTGSGDNVHQPARRRSANQAWYEYMPADIYYSSSESESWQNIRIYRELRFGKLAHLVMTDERLYRSDHLIPEAAINPATGSEIGSIGSRYMVQESTLAAVEAAKIAATSGTSLDPLIFTSILGKSQRDWWKATMQGSSATWKLWGNEVSLLKMGLDGSQAIATLVALNFIPTLASNIASTASAVGNDNRLAAAIVAAVAAGADSSTAASAAVAIATSAGSGGSASAQVAAAMNAGLNSTQAGLAVSAFGVVASSVAGGASASAQQAAGALAIAELLTGQSGSSAVFAAVKADIVANQADSAFIPASLKSSLASYFTRFVLNADQWDGFNAERKQLMAYLSEAGVSNVVALTGDIHAFYAGTVRDDYSASGGTPVMVDLVTAGVSSDSFFSYLKDAVGSLSSSLSSLIYYPLSVPVSGLGTLSLNLNLLDHSLRNSAPTAASLAQSLRVQLRGALADLGLAEAALDSTSSAVLSALQSDASFSSELLALAQALAAMDSNPWLAHANTDAQGYAVVSLSKDALRCEFKQVNKLVAGNAPASVLAGSVVATVQAGSAAVSVA